MPRNIEEFMNFYGIKHTKKYATFYKAVRLSNGEYHSDHDYNFIYEIGKEKTENVDTDINEECGTGIHISHLNWALEFGKDWDNLAILEVKVAIEDIVMPKKHRRKSKNIKS